MDSWREETAQTVQDDLDGLVESALGAAQGLLQVHGEFFPFALAVGLEGATEVMTGDSSLGEAPTPHEVLDHLYGVVREADGRFRAAAFVTDVSGESSDAVRVEVEHRDGGPALAVYLPYQKSEVGELSSGQLMADEGQRRVWQH